MKKTVAVLSFVLALAVCTSSAADLPRTFTVKADRIAVDNVTKAAVLTGHVEAVSEPVHLLSDLATRDADGVMRLNDPTSITSCTNHPGICHWALKGEVEYLDGKYVMARNVWLEFYELPVFWLPYFYYPLEGECALRVMPGYMSRWGAYILTKYVYEIAGDPTHQDNTWWMHGNTRFDLRYENGVALGETLYWNFGDFGRGKFKIYYAWDENHDEYDTNGYTGYGARNWGNWGSNVDRDRYAIELTHRWEPTERDVVRIKGSIYSDSHFRDDFFRDNFFNIKSEWLGYNGNEVAWEHNENAFGAGISVSGPLNKFYGGMSRLPEIYFDVQPQPVLSSPVIFESENRIGFLSRQAAEYGNGLNTNPYAHNPGAWADYSAFRFDSYDRFSLPFRTLDDFLSVVPRVAYHATGWGKTGRDNLGGWDVSHNAASAFRSILEGGVTFAARGQGQIGEKWQHVIEPYLDFLAQRAWFAGLGTGTRPYVFDNLDASVMWEDQFAGRARNLPYSYYGITPGVRNAFGKLLERGGVQEVFDIDVYAALQFNEADFIGDDDYHKLAKNGSPNYGGTAPYVMPGARAKWKPSDDISLLARVEYDSDNSKVAFGDVGFSQTVNPDFSYYVKYAIRDYRMWDFSSTPYDPAVMKSDDFNRAYFHYVQIGFTQHPIDWFAWSPFIRWDITENELDTVGAWFDYLTDCLGFRLLIEYDNEYTRIDGYSRKADTSVGFYIYLRALGAENANIFD